MTDPIGSAEASEPRKNPEEPEVSGHTAPSRRDKFRPVEMLVMSFIVAVVIGFVVWGSTREFTVGAIFGGVAFIVCVVVLATLQITTIPDREEIKDLLDQDRDSKGRGGH